MKDNSGYVTFDRAEIDALLAEPHRFECSICGRKSWNTEPYGCFMPQPNGSVCKGKMIRSPVK